MNVRQTKMSGRLKCDRLNVRRQCLWERPLNSTKLEGWELCYVCFLKKKNMLQSFIENTDSQNTTEKAID